MGFMGLNLPDNHVVYINSSMRGWPDIMGIIPGVRFRLFPEDDNWHDQAFIMLLCNQAPNAHDILYWYHALILWVVYVRSSALFDMITCSICSRVWLTMAHL